MIKKICLTCKKEFWVRQYRKTSAKFCSRKCKRPSGKEGFQKGHKPFSTGNPNFKKGHIPWNKGKDGLTICPICKKQFWVKPFVKKRGSGIYCSGKCYGKWRSKNIRGKNHPNWKGSKCKKYDKRNDPLYQNWVKQVKKRDNYTCRVKHKSCSGYNIVHHIKGWKLHPELRYEINNGITLCQAHHPLKRAEEKRLEPLFQALVSVSS